MTRSDRRVIAGCKLPMDGPLKENEMLWVEMLRLLFDDQVPVPSLNLVQALRAAARPPPDERGR